MFDFDWDFRFRVNLWFLIQDILKSGFVFGFNSFLFLNVHVLLHEEDEDSKKRDEDSKKEVEH